jgi:hypothetical protein
VSSLDERSLGWLRYLYRKATTPDDWDRDGHPHAHWDETTGEPMTSWHRFDLIDSSYAIALMSDRTPAWREVYSSILGDGPITGLDEPAKATTLLQFCGEFADAATKQRLWAAAEDHIEPTWDREAGEFTLGFGLHEPYPRGQMNARAMAGWVCTSGAWARIFNAPNLAKFDEPTVEGVDFPRVALSKARWDGKALHISAHPQNAALAGTRTSVRITNISSTEGWIMTGADGNTLALAGNGNHVNAELVVDRRPVVIRRE